ncbi:MAG: hypothetical protein LBD25_00920, partial [Coriobacteriales bacterium]|nr:hypothetical protein [Coriobacteriales bacterium]
MRNPVSRITAQHVSHAPRLRRLLTGVLCVLVVCSMLPSFSLPAYADPTSAEKKAEVDATAAKLNDWLTQLEQATNDYYAALDAHDAAVVRMDEAQGRIDAAEAVISSTQAELSGRASAMYKSGPLSFLDVLFGATSFEDFSSRWDLLNSVNSQNASLIAQNKAAKHEAETAHAEYAVQEQLAAEKLAQ